MTGTPTDLAPALTTNQPDQASTFTNKPRNRGRVQQRDQAATLQRFAFDAALALRTACTKPDGSLAMTPAAAKAIKDLLGAWDTAADRLRVIRGRGLPASERAKISSHPSRVQPLAGQ